MALRDAFESEAAADAVLLELREKRERERREVREALGPEACEDIDALIAAFDGKLVYARAADGREWGRRA